jgi:hypothetical protein
MVVSCLCPKLLTEESLYNSMRLFGLIIADTILLVNMLHNLLLCGVVKPVLKYCILTGTVWVLVTKFDRMKNENIEWCLVAYI